jgi:hypothetical protein
MSTQEHLPPNQQKVGAALPSIGYTFEAAVADIVDNSIDAKARSVLVRLVLRRDRQLDLAILDDGVGLSPEGLREAMRFGSDLSQDTNRLGKFGLGLKLASQSQAKQLHVLSAVGSTISGRAWLESGVESDYTNTVYDAQECGEILDKVIPDRRIRPSGTLVWWSRLYRVGHNHANPEELAQKLLRRLENHLALAFHRFLSGRPRSVAITMDIYDERERTAGIPSSLDPLDPFGYDQSGRPGYPLLLELPDGYRERLTLKAHIWPPNSRSPGYKLHGGANNRQGFYFYRNNRLIQMGGWNGMREAEPHSSLARLEVDMAPDFDLEISLDIKKVEIQLPASLVKAIQAAKTSSGTDLKKYLAAAQEAYRKRRPAETELPLIPSVGLPSDLKRFLHSELRIKGTAKHRDLKFQWKRLEADLFFDIDRDTGHLYLNRRYRNQLLHGLAGSAADIPVVKCLLFLALQEALLSERMSARIRDRIDRVNRILTEAVKFERQA